MTFNLDFTKLAQDLYDKRSYYFEEGVASKYMKTFYKSLKVKTIKSELYSSDEPLYDFELGYKNLKFRKDLQKKNWEYYCAGSSRAVFENIKKPWVLKVPWKEAGLFDNILEFSIWKERYKYPNLNPAKCRLLPSGYLIMEKVKLLNDNYNEKINYNYNLRDGFQVGLSKDGKLKAYDYAREHWVWQSYYGEFK